MCGIVGYIGKKNAYQILIDGLKRLEYRGYDSAGISIINNNSKIVAFKQKGKVSEVESAIDSSEFTGNIGIGHTRWATHGEPNDVNAHPHFDMDENIIIVHNGIIENYKTLQKFLSGEGFTNRSETDTEILANLMNYYYRQTKNFEQAVRNSLNDVEGTYGVACLCAKEPDRIIVARKGSPLMLGVSMEEIIIASDASAIINHTKNVMYLEDGEMAVLTKQGFQLKTIKDEDIYREIQELDFELSEIEKGGFEHFMLKEICEQSDSIQNTYRGRINFDTGVARLGGLEPVMEKILNAKRILITACGTAWHAGLTGEYMLESCARIPVEVDYASEFRYRNPIIYPDDVVFVISQSGETADTLSALREAKNNGATTVGIVNAVGSTIAREVDAGTYIHAGPEIGVASTKAFTCQLMSLTLISMMLAEAKGAMDSENLKRIADEIKMLPEKIQTMIDRREEYKFIAEEFKDARNFLYLGRGYNFPAALEGALKLKEISYIHAEGYPAAEMKHGPIALIDENMPVVFIAPKDKTYDKIISNIEEVKARKGRIISIAFEDDDQIAQYSDFVLRVPKTINILTPIINSIPLQFLAYYIATARGCNVDQPRNLAKSVTVE
ncbi:MAG: glutamine--fructose-6-phosphate transaminase (isomerizing) [Ignavibacteriaceae bacterium]|jgi:glucosamine--fructose-6-phosphate aminotransferase (isomerizing)|nr:MAG: glutamine--fructose-6-phosphate transaminase (isomerizing) [Chlorobiota bacterium]KXK06118.1 MAG: glucosamine 6-phosphate synthetase [Chlorobi bacterium OLB4]MBV6398547.1 Glutamine--fructose-6-phosphate aminotransferase [isomerizing] [Ignavibacteria bacterium]MCC6885781.1 glutamine--fructose-6-phosphate transaminase (isomerizing) [Ignavibacteriales bacterium]MCE7953024.1 glutamine--fructose-6-phosphate transaminase (isomerizing) [Chlorobi bacterium CHB7]MDL1887138.1 glutamine--fructose